MGLRRSTDTMFSFCFGTATLTGFGLGTIGSGMATTRYSPWDLRGKDKSRRAKDATEIPAITAVGVELIFSATGKTKTVAARWGAYFRQQVEVLFVV